MSTISAGSFLAERHTKKRRISSVVDVGGPIEDTDTAILKLLYVGFDLGKYNKDINEEQKILYITEDTIFNGKSGIMALIGDHASVEQRASKIHILCQLADLLSAFIEDEPLYI
ncbi:hypothetical protein FRACYDRAFT_243957 [Fragilariopsis cylindrus CCMP1102]|uniref:Uncharacterized protein n=1 Tax=Fragilariopsis cylindrus CCMP1102 TaxID=635003 RepID=A0A1E7F3E7_9STRA|nr:hypothetical protein FRACYDRAFT_243957 [Fragilariopsis cylindrus CCMP1102]|eukprot:OEU12700.1 hypothetical protein FRACYDRAFT_243957 [Fragilariopsis cylindrus CCMP1102]